jgi:hypothetical protein
MDDTVFDSQSGKVEKNQIIIEVDSFVGIH